MPDSENNKSRAPEGTQKPGKRLTLGHIADQLRDLDSDSLFGLAGQSAGC